jgi:hypothetical protein
MIWPFLVASLLLWCIWLFTRVVYFEFRGKPASVTLLPYQRGILFRKGVPVRDVGPGVHRVWTGTELLVHGDTRPISVNYEKLVVDLQDGFAALYSFSASVEVQNMRKAVYSARNYTNVPAFVLLGCTRRHLNACFGTSLNLERDTVVSRIMEDAKAKLSTAGFNLMSFRLTQLVIGTTQMPMPAPQTTPRPSS